MRSFQGRDKSRHARTFSARERIAPTRAPGNVEVREPGPDVDSIESWFQRLMDRANLFNEVNPRSVAAILPVARAVVGLYR